METVHDTDVVFEAVAESGLRATIGKCMMDFDAQVPTRLQEQTRASIDESVAIRTRWDGAANGRLRAAFAPRFAVSCSRELLEAVAQPVGASTTRSCTRTRRNRATRSRSSSKLTGGLTQHRVPRERCASRRRTCARRTACGWTIASRQLLADHDVKVMHCPGSNLKLGSGIAPVPEMRARGITVSLGADGAACNNRLDMFEEMRLAAVLQAMRAAAGRRCRRATCCGWRRARARARSGSRTRSDRSRPGKRADLIVVDRDRPHLAPGPDPYSTLVYAARGSDVRTTIVDGEVLVDEFAPVRVDRAEIAARGAQSRAQLASCAGSASVRRQTRCCIIDLAVIASDC